jgi:hypothetical protein
VTLRILSQEQEKLIKTVIALAEERGEGR